MKSENKLKFTFARNSALLSFGIMFASVCAFFDALWRLCFFPLYYETNGDTRRSLVGKLGMAVAEKLVIYTGISNTEAFAEYIETNLKIE